MIPINIKNIRVQSFLIECSETLQYGKSVVLGLSGDVTQINGKDNQDGTQNVTYTVKPQHIRIEGVFNGVTKTISSTETSGKSKSKQARSLCYRVCQEIGESEESLYNLYDEAGRQAVENHRLSVIGYKE